MGVDLFADDELCARLKHGTRCADGGVNALDLRRLHLQAGVLPQTDIRRRVHDVLAVAVARGVVLFHILHLGVFPDMEGMDAAVLARRLPAIMDAAARDDEHVRAVLHIEIVVYLLLVVRLGDDDGNMNALPLRLARNKDIDARFAILSALDADMRRAAASVRLAVLSDIVCTVRHLVQVGDLHEQHFFQFVHSYLTS